MHFIHCKDVLFSIANAIGKPLRVDHATVVVNQPSITRVPIELDVLRPLLPKLWTSEGDGIFWQNVIFERVPLYYASCKHLGYSTDTCFVANPGL